MLVDTRGGRIHKFKDSDPTRRDPDPIRIRQYTTTLCPYQRKPKVDQRKKEVLSQNWGVFSAKIRVETNRKKRSLQNVELIVFPNYLKGQSQIQIRIQSGFALFNETGSQSAKKQ